jgi:Immunity protein 53
MESLSLLEKWYLSQCNGEWEHQHGIRIETIDNPGWSLTINLNGTQAENGTLNLVKIERAENDWIHYWVEKNQFHARVGPQNLTEGIKTFLGWIENLK